MTANQTAMPRFPRRDIGKGWFVEYDKRATIESQTLIFDQPAIPSNHHSGGRAEYHINGLTGKVLYLDGDWEQFPDKHTRGRACEALKQLQEGGLLFQEQP